MNKKFKLKNTQEFQRAYSKGKGVKNKDLFFCNIYDSKHDYPRFGFAVSKKIGNAVARNRVKRSFREIIGSQDISALKNFDYVFVPLPKFDNIPFSKKKEEVTKFLRKYGK